MEITYFNGIRFTRKDSNSYFRNSTIKERLHRYVWKYYNGDIPKGYDIHHIDGDKGNNDISNLQLIERSKHLKLHGSKLSEEEREWRRNNIKENAQPKSIEWHKSEEGRKWHSEHIKQQHENGTFKRIQICSNCGKEYIGKSNRGNTFCSSNCKSAYRRKTNKDLIEKNCIICGNKFNTNKYRQASTCSRSCANKWRKQNES